MKKDKKKRSVALLLSASVILGAAACQNSQTSGNSSTGTFSGSQTEYDVIYTVDTDTASLDETHEISDTLFGLFLEDINFAVDGGLYTELVKNRSFEYGSRASYENRHGWSKTDSAVEFSVTDGSEDGSALNSRNAHYAVITNTSSGSSYQGISNGGFLDGLAVTKDEKYVFSIYMRSDSYKGKVYVSLEDTSGNTYAFDYIDSVNDIWTRYELTLIPNETVNKRLRLNIKITEGTVYADVVSLMPAESFAGLNIRKDIGEALMALNPSFLRFPGGCVIEGSDLESMYNWKDSIGNGISFDIHNADGTVTSTTGDIAVRPQGRSIWNGNSTDPYYTTYGIGFYEYFCLCEALDCLPVPVLNAGMTCQPQSSNYVVFPLNSEEFAACIQDALDLVEFCLGDESTYWGKIRSDMGHPEPFNLKYIAIGNEQWQTEYHAHYQKFVEAFETAARKNPALYKDIQLIVANGTSSGSTEGWSYVSRYPDEVTALVDEHYYEPASWFYTNTHRYDTYSRDEDVKVFLGEYAAQANTMNAALAEAAFMTGLEKNGDIVKMACYAPLFGNDRFNQWTPDMMFFSNSTLRLTPNYYVQQMFARNPGTTELNASLDTSGLSSEYELHGSVGLGSWMTSVVYDNLTITSNETGSILYSTDFESTSTLRDDDFINYKGNWSVANGKLMQTNTASPSDTNTGDVVYVGSSDWSNYTLTVDASITGGSEGFLIPVCVEDMKNNIFWNVGGWGNTVSCLQIVSNGSKSGQISGTVKSLKLSKNKTYTLKVVVSGANIKCYIDDVLYVDYTSTPRSEVYESATMTEDGDIIIKLVNTTDTPLSSCILLENFNSGIYETLAQITCLSADSLTAANTKSNPENVVPAYSELAVSDNTEYTIPAYSLSVIRIKRK